MSAVRFPGQSLVYVPEIGGITPEPRADGKALPLGPDFPPRCECAARSRTLPPLSSPAIVPMLRDWFEEADARDVVPQAISLTVRAALDGGELFLFPESITQERAPSTTAPSQHPPWSGAGTGAMRVIQKGI
jgi:hypothetical protein